MSGFQEFTTQISLYFGDGRVFFLGCLLAGAGAAGSRQFTSKWGRVFDYAAWIGMLLVILSGTPLPWWAYAIWSCAFLLALLGHHLPKLKLSRKIILPFFAVITLSMGIAEGLHHRMPSLEIPTNQPVYILGDSISAGVGGPETVWPEVWAKHSGREVINLAVPGAKIKDALERQQPGIERKPATVIIEIGGNDLMGGTPASDFHRQLDTLLAQLSSDGHQLILFELPLLPLGNRMGRSQRVLAKKHGAILIPKRLLVDVFETPEATLDGLHLSQTGHNELARKIQALSGRKP